MSLFSKDPTQQGEISDLIDNSSVADEAQQRIQEAQELEEAAIRKAAKRNADADLTGTDDTFISEDDLSFLKTK